jgi:hypothetical protein
MMMQSALLELGEHFNYLLKSSNSDGDAAFGQIYSEKSARSCSTMLHMEAFEAVQPELNTRMLVRDVVLAVDVMMWTCFSAGTVSSIRAATRDDELGDQIEFGHTRSGQKRPGGRPTP